MTIKPIKSFMSPRIKSLCTHQTQPLMLASLYTGDVQVWSTDTLTLKRTIAVSQKPCRTAIFYEPLDYIIAGDDEGCITIMDMAGNQVARFIAHGDFIRRVTISSNVLISCSDDCTLKSWCLKTFKILKVFESHTHFVMDVTSDLVSVGLDGTIKFWNLNGKLKKSIDAHDSGINTIASLSNVFVTGSDDTTIKAWDPSPIATINAHTKSVNRLVRLSNKQFASCSEDGYLKLWNFNFVLETSVNLRSRLWDVAQKSCKLFVATDEALVVLEDKSEQVLVAMSTEKVFYTTGPVLYYHRISAERKTENKVSESGSAYPDEGASEENKNEERERKEALARSSLSTIKEIQLDYIPASLSASPSGKVISLIHNSTFTIYSVLGFRSRLTGPGEEVIFVEDQEYLVRSDKVYFYRRGDLVGELNFKADALFVVGGHGLDLASIDFDAMNATLEKALECTDHTEITRLDAKLGDGARNPIIAVAGGTSQTVVALDTAGKAYLVARLKPKFVFRVKGNLVLCTEKKLIVVNESGKFEIDKAVDEGVVCEDVVYVRSNGKLYYLLISDTLGRGKGYREPIFYSVRIFQGRLIGVRDSNLLYVEGGKVQMLEIDKAFIAWQVATLNGTEAPITNVNNSIKFLQLIGEHEKALGLTNDDNVKFEILLNLKRLDEAMDLANNPLKYQKLAKEFLKLRRYDRAAKCFYHVKDAYNCYLVDFEREFRLPMNDSNLSFFMALEDGEFKKCAELLKTTVFYNLFKNNYVK